MRFRYRRLTAHRDPHAVAELRAELSQGDSPGDDLNAAMRAEMEAPRQIIAVESQGTLEEIEELLRTRRLLPSDLVVSRGNWTTFSEAPEFFEFCANLGDSAVRKGFGGLFFIFLQACSRAIAFLVNLIFRYRTKW